MASGSGAPVHRGSRRPVESEETTIFDTPYGQVPPSSTAASRPFGSNSNSTGQTPSSSSSSTLAFSKAANKEESYLGTAKEWVVQEPLLAKGKLEKGRRPGDGPLTRLGGGLENLSRVECALLLGLVLLAFVVRLWRIDRPDSVVFDEVHFGGFATKYIKRKFFMDVHPPLAKLMITMAARIFRFSGNFDFKDIGKEYAPLHVPYIPMRLVGGLFGVSLIPVSYLTMRVMSLNPTSALLVALLVTFENGLITQSRLILLDSPLVFFVALTTFLFQAFSVENTHRPFTRKWWVWLALCGLSLGAVLSIKWVGLFTVATIGVATLLQLWDLLGDLKISMPTLFRHFVARAIGLIVLPVLFYMICFEVHFMVLKRSGDGDGFMSSEFQHSLKGHGMKDTYADVQIGSQISIRHLNTQGGYLHSHPHNYPTGSKQQQITLYPHRDDNNLWTVQNATKDDSFNPFVDLPTRPIRDRQWIRLNHTISHKMLHSHDHRPPISEVDWQNEVSGYGFEGFDGDANDQWIVEFLPDYSTGSKAKKQLQAIKTKFRLRHVLSGCYLFSHKVKLPEWGFGQQEVTCNRNPSLPNSIWFIETNTHPLLDSKAEKINYQRPGFLARFLELNKVMWRTNKGLTDRHSYDSRPEHWPWLRRGINFWVKDHRQIYLIGNPVIWWLSSLSILGFAGVRALLVLRAKRSYQDFTNTTVVYYDRVCTFLAAGWALHYFPFFIMGRQLFLHHYFPALYFSILMLGAVFDFCTSRLKSKTRLQVAGVIVLLSLWSWHHWSPLAYAGQWTKKDCHNAQWLQTWDFSCNSFPKGYAYYNAKKGAGVDLHTTVHPDAHGTQTTAAAVIEPGRNMFQEKMVEKKPETTGKIDQADHEPEVNQKQQPLRGDEAPKDPAIGGGDDKASTTAATRENNDEQAPVPQNAPAETNKDREDMPLEVAEALEAAEAKEHAEEVEHQKQASVADQGAQEAAKDSVPQAQDEAEQELLRDLESDPDHNDIALDDDEMDNA